ncbi:tryptophan-rich sensory protein [Paenibacillus koleovorans]|uniref:tryptophan-rich sensory protein n=1 Tax=Paenibacillus koleovorans TaxID=121608 RepID=UPI000FDA5A40|nr:tryptophan-rich sensory protein [Paenibacillus koleovorans]
MVYRWWNVAAFAVVLALNGLAYVLPLGGRTTGEISAMFPVLIAPAPYAFSIWGVIYLLLAGFILYQLLPGAKKERELESVGPWFAISCMFNVAWLLLWHALKIESSVFIMSALLITLCVLYLRTRSNTRSSKVQWLVQLPFSLYLGWITVATIVNVAIVLYSNDVKLWGLSDELWTIILLVLAAGLAVLVGGRYYDPAFIAVFVWAFIAIGASMRASGSMKAAAWLLAAALFVYALNVLKKVVR